MNTRRKGSAFEYKVRDYLKEKGYFVTRSTVSKFPDLIAIPEYWENDQRPMFVECKSRKSGLSKKEKLQFGVLTTYHKIRACIAYPKYSIYSKKEDNIVIEEL